MSLNFWLGTLPLTSSNTSAPPFAWHCRKKDSKDEPGQDEEAKDEPMKEESDEDSGEKPDPTEDVDVRDVRYKLETLG